MKSPEQLAMEAVDKAVRESCDATIDRAYLDASIRANADRIGVEIIDWSLDGKLLRMRCKLPAYPAHIDTPIEYPVADE